MKISEILRYYPFLIFNSISKNNIYKGLILRKENETPSNLKKYQIKKENDIKSSAEKYTSFYKVNSHFPIISKNDIQKSIDDFISENYNRDDLFKITTSGSYGTPSIFYRDKQKKINQIADVLYFGKENNYYFGVKHAFIRGIKKSRKSLVVQNEIHLSPNKLGQKEMERYYIELKKVSHIVGFPSVILNFINFCKEFNLKRLTNIKGITFTAEPLTIEQRNEISEFFNCPVLTRYASEEVGIIANRYPDENFYRINETSIKLDIWRIL